MWNVKENNWDVEFAKTGRFNRYIVECKDAHLVVCRRLYCGFNRYIVECKMAYGRKSETLIDQEVNKTQPGSVIIREFEEVGDLTVTS